MSIFPLCPGWSVLCERLCRSTLLKRICLRTNPAIKTYCSCSICSRSSFVPRIQVKTPLLRYIAALPLDMLHDIDEDRGHLPSNLIPQHRSFEEVGDEKEEEEMEEGGLDA